MAQEDVDLALGLSVGSGTGNPHLLQPKEAPPLEPSLTLSLTIAVKREKVEEENKRAMIYYSAASSAADDDIEGCNNSGSSRKKLKLTKEQSALLEGRFKEHSTLDTKQKTALARQLNLRPRQVEVWFQNRRARTKLKQTEVDCELLKSCCETLTEENRRLHLELQQLHHQQQRHPTAAFFMPAAAMLSVCPSCNRLAPAPPAHAAAAADRPASKRSFFATNSAASARQLYPHKDRHASMN
ncbi:homeobox-leucine zipper protein HOX15-like [Lolium rigidum]|uniref:homeobox-leucine zipper protein HOX15-like n=1 Tax=Lolium rigidum TaxID=89674 RepID=UPI001F5C59AA|nr:homeobox-leucine zipper protein HOX15-like [Lolium rigidum]